MSYINELAVQLANSQCSALIMNNCEGPVLPLQPVGSSCPLPGSDFLRSACALPSRKIITVEVAADMSARSSLGVNSKIRSSSIADCNSVPNSPQMKQLQLSRVGHG